MVISTIKDKAYDKGYSNAVRDSAGKVQDFAYWMSKYPMIYNTLTLLANRVKTQSTTWYLREEILKLGETLIDALPEEEQKQYLTRER